MKSQQQGSIWYAPGVSVGDDRPHIINIRRRFPLLRRQLSPRVPVLPVVHLLGLEQPLDLVGDGVVRVVAKVWRHFVCGREEGGAGPSGDVQNLLVGRLLGHLNGINRTDCEALRMAHIKSQTRRNVRVCIGLLSAALSLSRLKSLRAIIELG